MHGRGKKRSKFKKKTIFAPLITLKWWPHSNFHRNWLLFSVLWSVKAKFWNKLVATHFWERRFFMTQYLLPLEITTNQRNMWEFWKGQSHNNLLMKYWLDRYISLEIWMPSFWTGRLVSVVNPNTCILALREKRTSDCFARWETLANHSGLVSQRGISQNN